MTGAISSTLSETLAFEGVANGGWGMSITFDSPVANVKFAFGTSGEMVAKAYDGDNKVVASFTTPDTFPPISGSCSLPGSGIVKVLIETGDVVIDDFTF